MKNEHIVSSIEEGSIAWELGIKPGDKLLKINEEVIEDVFDYHYLVNDEELLLLIETKDGEQWEAEIEKDYEEDLGIEFEQGLMDEYRSCKNKCMFCFIDQMPEGMRDTLYFKDDDSRLSFLQGNYITLTNMTDHDIERIVKYHLEPINISFHTTNPELRCKMLHNRFAGDALKKVKMLYDGGIQMNGQIVLCKGYNDGEELERSIKDMADYIPHLQSVSVVPVGLTKFRKGLEPLTSFQKEDAKQVLAIIHKWQKKLYAEHGMHFIHAGDEWYILAEEDMPEEVCYDGYLQLENGVGMTRLLEDEFKEALEQSIGNEKKAEISMATGVLAYAYIKKMLEQMQEKFPNVKVHLYQIVNHFFGEKITVAGLITGTDLTTQLKGKPLGSKLLLPCSMFRSGEDVFLDDITRKEAEDALQVEIDIVKSSGQDFMEAIINNQLDI